MYNNWSTVLKGHGVYYESWKGGFVTTIGKSVVNFGSFDEINRLAAAKRRVFNLDNRDNYAGNGATFTRAD